MRPHLPRVLFFFFNDTATTEIYTLSLHDALPISPENTRTISAMASATPSIKPNALTLSPMVPTRNAGNKPCTSSDEKSISKRSEEHTSELQSRLHLVCRLLLEKKKTKRNQAQSQT